MVQNEMVKNRRSGAWRPSRREMLSAAATTALGLLSGTESGFGQATQPQASQPGAA